MVLLFDLRPDHHLCLRELLLGLHQTHGLMLAEFVVKIDKFLDVGLIEWNAWRPLGRRLVLKRVLRKLVAQAGRLLELLLVLELFRVPGLHVF